MTVSLSPNLSRQQHEGNVWQYVIRPVLAPEEQLRALAQFWNGGQHALAVTNCRILIFKARFDRTTGVWTPSVVPKDEVALGAVREIVHPASKSVTLHLSDGSVRTYGLKNVADARFFALQVSDASGVPTTGQTLAMETQSEHGPVDAPTNDWPAKKHSGFDGKSPNALGKFERTWFVSFGLALLIVACVIVFKVFIQDGSNGDEPNIAGVSPSDSTPMESALGVTLRRAGVTEMLLGQLNSVAAETNYGLNAGELMPQKNIEELAVVMVMFCGDIEDGSVTWQGSVVDGIERGHTRSDVVTMNNFLRATFCPLVDPAGL